MKKIFKKKFLFVTLSLVFMICLGGFLANYFDLINLNYAKFYLKGYGDVVKTVKKDEEVFNSGEKKRIEALVYTGEYLDYDIKREPSDLLSFFFKNADIKLKDVDDSYLTFEVCSRDISDIKVTDDLKSWIIKDKGFDFTSFIKEYYLQAKDTSKNITLKYNINEKTGNIRINYNDYTFKDSVYGGLLGVYDSLSKEMFGGNEKGADNE